MQGGAPEQGGDGRPRSARTSVADVVTCSSCGGPLSAGARFCSACGWDASAELFPAELFPDLFDIDGPGARVGSAAVGPIQSGGANRVWVLAGLVGLLAIVWLLTRSPDDSTDVEQTFERSGTTEGQRVPSTERADTEEPADAARTTTTIELDRPYHLSVPGIAEGGPVLGIETGLSLYVGRRNLAEIDLDTGEVRQHELTGTSNASLIPIYADAEWLVLLDNGGMKVVPRSDPNAPVRPLGDGLYWSTALREASLGHVWMITSMTGDGTFESLIWASVSLADGSVSRTVDAMPYSFGGSASSPEITTSPAGGIFVLDAGGGAFRRLADGIPLAFSDELVLVRVCDAPRACSDRWVDRESGDDIERPIPEIPLQPWAVELSRDGRLAYWSADSGGTLWDVERAQVVGQTSNEFSSIVAFSPDGRFAAFVPAGADQIVLYDSVAGQATTITIPDEVERSLGGSFTVGGLAFAP